VAATKSIDGDGGQAVRDEHACLAAQKPSVPRSQYAMSPQATATDLKRGAALFRVFCGRAGRGEPAARRLLSAQPKRGPINLMVNRFW